jgi:Flp pilus assembly pilin Flp
MNLKKSFLTLLKDEQGAELAEYAVGVALLVAIAVVVYKVLGDSINDSNSGTAAKVSTAVSDSGYWSGKKSTRFATQSCGELLFLLTGGKQMNNLKRFLSDEQGAELAEYAVGTAILVAVAIIVYKVLGNAVNVKMSTVANEVQK